MVVSLQRNYVSVIFVCLVIISIISIPFYILQTPLFRDINLKILFVNIKDTEKFIVFSFLYYSSDECLLKSNYP